MLTIISRIRGTRPGLEPSPATRSMRSRPCQSSTVDRNARVPELKIVSGEDSSLAAVRCSSNPAALCSSRGRDEVVGEIAIKGHNIVKGYYNRPEATAGAIRDGWFRSGD
jgi:long-subunit acyl-CoA synthetase (AMP-forming)